MRCVVTSLTAALLSTVALSGAALAQRAATETEMRAGPREQFPVITRVSPNETLQVHGCVEGYRWCDVSWRNHRGWLPADQLEYTFEDREVRVSENGPRLELPVVGFAFSAYWDSLYSKQPWYGERDRWKNMWRDQPEYLRYGRAERGGTAGGSVGGGGRSAGIAARDRARGDSFGVRAENEARTAVERSAEAGVEPRSNAEAGRGDDRRIGPDIGPDQSPTTSGVNQPSGGGEIRGSVEGAPSATTPGNTSGPSTGSNLTGPTPGNPAPGSTSGGGTASGAAGAAGGTGSSGGASGSGGGGGGSGGGGGGGG